MILDLKRIAEHALWITILEMYIAKFQIYKSLWTKIAISDFIVFIINDYYLDYVIDRVSLCDELNKVVFTDLINYQETFTDK